MQTNSLELTTDGRFVTIKAKPEPVIIDTTRSAACGGYAKRLCRQGGDV